MLRFVVGCIRLEYIDIQCYIIPKIHYSYNEMNLSMYSRNKYSNIYILFGLLQNITYNVTSATSKQFELINVVLLKQFFWDVEKMLEMVLESYWNKL